MPETLTLKDISDFAAKNFAEYTKQTKLADFWKETLQKARSHSYDPPFPEERAAIDRADTSQYYSREKAAEALAEGTAHYNEHREAYREIAAIDAYLAGIAINEGA